MSRIDKGLRSKICKNPLKLYKIQQSQWKNRQKINSSKKKIQKSHQNMKIHFIS